MSKFQFILPSDLMLHPDNPRLGNVEAIKDSIRAHGFRGVIIRQASTGYVLAGNHRVKAARELGLDALPVETLDCDDDAARRILLVDNKAADAGRYDDQTLLDILEGLGSLEGTGYTGDDLDDVLVRLEGALTAPESPFNGGYAETEEERQARSGTSGQTRAQQGFSEAVLAYDIGDHRTFLVEITKRKSADKTMTTGQAVLDALRAAAAK